MLYLAADGGGTKLHVVLFDEEANLLSTGASSGTNTVFRSVDDVRAAMSQALRKCLGPCRLHLDGAAFAIVGPGELFVECIREQADVDSFTRIGEGQNGILAGTGGRYGLLAQAGTGSDVFYVQPDSYDMIGGWGTVLGDEGSGYDIGMKTLRATIYASDGRGPMTVLLPMIREAWKLEKLWDMVSAVYESPDQRRLVASASRFTARAAAMGDEVALSIYREAAESMALMAVTMLDRHDRRLLGPLVVSGGVWKGCGAMFDTFSQLVHRKYPDVDITLPAFEPVVGGVVLQLLERGLSKENFWNTLLRNFSEFQYKQGGNP